MSISTVPPPSSQTVLHVRELEVNPPPPPVVNVVYDPEPVFENPPQTDSTSTLNITV